MSKQVRYALAAVAVLAALVVGLLVAAIWTVRQTPTFYSEALAADPVAQSAASDELESRATALLNDVRNLESWETLITAEQINGYLAVDFAEKHPGVLPPNVHEPRVHIDAERLTVAFQVDLGGAPCVYSVEADVYLSEPNVVACRIKSARAGLLPLPLKTVLDKFTAASTHLKIPIRWVQEDGDPVALLEINPDLPDENRRIVLDAIQLQDGQLYLSGETQPREASEKPEAAQRQSALNMTFHR